MKRLLPLLLAVVTGLTLGLVPLSAHANSSSSTTKVYTQPGDHLVNGRYWKTSCKNYSSTVIRCTTSIWGSKEAGRNGWVFNTLTYLPSPRANWSSNPLGRTGSWTASDGRKWRTECDTAKTGGNGCRSYTLEGRKWVVNNLVHFSAPGNPAVTRVPAAAAALKGAPVEKAAAAASPNQSAAKKAVSVALTEVGSNYAHGAAGPNSFDCSGLTSYAYKKAGITLPRNSRSQYSAGSHVSKSNLKPGDLVFFYSPISHVGIYLGNGKIVHAANPRSGVTTTTLNSMPFSGAVRVG